MPLVIIYLVVFFTCLNAFMLDFNVVCKILLKKLELNYLVLTAVRLVERTTLKKSR